MNNRRSYGYQKKNKFIHIVHRKKEKDYRISLKIKHNSKHFEKWRSLLKQP